MNLDQTRSLVSSIVIGLFGVILIAFVWQLQETVHTKDKQLLLLQVALVGGFCLLVLFVVLNVIGRKLIGAYELTRSRLGAEIEAHSLAKDALIEQQKAQISQAEKDLLVSRKQYHSLFNRTADAMMILAEGKFTEANPACLQLFGCEDQNQFLGLHLWDLSPPQQEDGAPSEQKAEQMIEQTQAQGSHRFEWLHRTRSGRVFPSEVLLTVIDGQDEPLVCAIVRDISKRKQAEEEIKYQAYYDSLSGLPNRRLMLDRISQALISSQRHGHYNALLFIDLDRFKFINDSLGHSVGDGLLVQIADALQNNIRNEDTVARFGGDEFVVLLKHLGDENESASLTAERIAEQLQQKISQSYEVNEHTIQVTSSIGIYLFPEREESLDDIIKQADTAMYSAKESGRNRIAFFQSTMQEAVVKRLALEKDLRAALQNNNIEVHYQPQISLDGGVYGIEALVRWIHPELGAVNPEEFISIAEDSGLIYQLGEFVLTQAIQDALALDHQPKHLSVNISPYQFRHPDFLQRIAAIIERFELEPYFLVLEITEGVVISNFDETVEKLRELKAMGVLISLDDFGTGYSSLSYLKKLPIDELKIDRSFVMDLEDDPHDAKLVQTIINIAHQFNLVTVAEGVETEAQKDFLTYYKCQVYQGYFYSKPLSYSALKAFLAKSSGG